MAFDGEGVAVVTGADTGGGDTGFSGDTGGSADTGADAGSDAALETGADTGAQEFEVDEATGEQRLDDEGNPVPKAAAPKGKVDFKSTYDKLKASDPAVAENYRKAHFGYEQYKQAFPTPQAAREAKDLFDTYGGAEGVEKLSNEASTFAEEMDRFSKGDPEFIAQLAKDDPEGFAATAGPYLATLGKNNPEAYQALLAPVIHTSMQQTGLTNSIVSAGQIIDRIYTALEKSGNKEHLPFLQQALDSLNKAWSVTEDYKKLGEKSGTRELTDKEKQFQQREQQLNQKEAEAFKKTVWTAQDGSIRTAITKSASQYYKLNPKMTAEQKETFESGIRDFVLRQMDSNQQFSKQYRALLKDGNVQKINTFFANEFNKKVADSAKRTWNRYGFGNLPNQNKAAVANKGTVNLTKRPNRSDIDWQKTTEVDFMSGVATLKGSGRQVKWAWESQ